MGGPSLKMNRSGITLFSRRKRGGGGGGGGVVKKKES